MDLTFSPVALLVALQFVLHALSWGLGAWFLRAERQALISWSVFLMFVGLGFGLMTLRDDSRSWWAFNGAALCWTAGLLMMWRGLVRHFGAPERVDWQLGLLAAGLAVALGVGPGVEEAPKRVALTYTVQLAVVAATVVNLLPTLRQRMSTARWMLISAPAFVMMAACSVVIVRQVANPGQALELHRFDGENLRLMIAFLVAAALFNTIFMCLVVARLLEQLRALSERDALTGLYNRRAMTERLGAQWSAWTQQGRGFALAVVDLDHFKRVNDTHGHEAGDQVLVQAAQRLRGLMHPDDVLARLGGEEFVLILPERDMAEARNLAERLCDALRRSAVAVGSTGLQVTASVGVARVETGDRGPEDVLRRADQALYQAKSAGRDRVAVAAG